MGRTITIDMDDLKRIMREVAVNAVYDAVSHLREGEAILSRAEVEKNRKAVEFMQNAENDTYLKGCEVAKILGCSTGQVTKLKTMGVLEPVYLNGSRTPKYSKLKLYKMIKDKTVPKYK
jgi:arginine/ornithine N-succinyltransferase beta subunit